MTVEQLVGVLRDQGFLRSQPVLPGQTDPTTEDALSMLQGAYEIYRDDEIVTP